MTLCSFVLVFMSLASPALAGLFVLPTFRSLVTARMDPVISPGIVSQHSHHIIGGSGFNTRYDPAKLRQSKCSNLPLQADKSNYWFPQIFQLLSNGSYVGMETGVRVYYFFQGGVDIKPFPYDLQFLVGDPARKSHNTANMFDNVNNYYCDRPESGKASYASDAFPRERCTVLIMKLFTPMCTNGQKYDPAKPSAHMAYTTDGWDGQICPRTHPIRLPSVLVESFHHSTTLKTPPPGKQQYILANGDTTGFGLHLDFTNGWDQTVLKDIVIGKCKNPSVGEPVEQGCPALAPYTNHTLGNSCNFEGLRPDESVGWLNGKDSPIDKLPGCNLPWTSGTKPTCTSSRSGRIALPVKWIKTKAGTLFP